MKTKLNTVAILVAITMLISVSSTQAVQVLQPQQRLVPSITPFANGQGYYLTDKVKNLLGHTETFYLTTEIFDDCDNDSQPLYEFPFTLEPNESIIIVTEFPLSPEACAERLTLHSDVFYRIPNQQNNEPYANKSIDYCIVPACGMSQ
jgi:hypothetical protein